ncbi:EthD family reductase [Ancylobacter terrae]|uniref:EthD family reductase n=1 Tax=Ancylobacter sp. sgz301288 TaxID=3342077 RepID=UPI00385833B9
MIKLVTFQKRVPSLTRPGFEERWRTVHGPIAATFPGLRGYMLGFSLDAGEPAADGIAQLWFDSREACQASYASDIGRNGSADASKWLARREHLLATEEWLEHGGDGAAPFKLVLCVKRPGIEARAAFLDRLRAAAKDLVGNTGAVRGRLSLDDAGLLLNSRTEGSLQLREGEAPYDALVELWFADRPTAEAGRAGLRGWMDVALKGRISRWEDALLSEHVVVPPPLAGGAGKEGLS